MNTQQKGQLAQLKIEQRAVELGFIVSKPTTDARYDLIVDDGTRLWRAQIKYSTGKSFHSQGAVRVDLRRWAGDKRWEWRTYKDSEVDVLIVYLPATDQIYWIPVEKFHGKTALYLRIQPTKTKQTKRITMADEYVWNLAVA